MEKYFRAWGGKHTCGCFAEGFLLRELSAHEVRGIVRVSQQASKRSLAVESAFRHRDMYHQPDIIAAVCRALVNPCSFCVVGVRVFGAWRMRSS